MDREPPVVYNVFPMLAGALEAWHAHARRARAMGVAPAEVALLMEA